MPKKSTVKKVFDSVARKYDLMNDLMSLGMHRLWKKHLISEIDHSKDHTLLDVAGGTGDIAMAFLDAGGESAIICDINENMLQAGNDKRINNGQYLKYKDFLKTVYGDAQNLPFPDNHFDRVVISFGIRNVESIEEALKEMFRVLKPSGKFICMEFINYNNDDFFKKIYDFYSFKCIPKIGSFIVGDSAPYDYLADSIRKFPSSKDFIKMMDDVGFENVTSRVLFPPVVSIWSGYKN